ncbi:MAG: SDR family NAD(P)-dependent oxidoreductase [Lysobacteraceae bacterium]|jgi:NAD(P)-dependent dehydrogenase (short-subunit alcohol dehydrogenase family)
MATFPSRILVTGGSRGLGLEFVRQCLARGDAVLAACRDPAGAPALAALADEAGDRLRVHALDVTDAASRASVREVVAAHWGAIDRIIHNAGVLVRDERLGALDPAAFREAFETNALAPLLLTEALLPLLGEGRAPAVAFITSQLGSIARTDRFYTPSYAMAKAALNMAGRLLAEPLHAAGIAGVLLHPGWVRTAMGGPQAPLEPREAVAGLLAVIDALPRDGAMRFLDYRGEELPW